MSALKRFAAITKVDDLDDGTVVVHGIASTESVDAQGETVTKGAMVDAIPDYLKHGTGALRSMHQPIAAGFVSKVEVNEAGETEITATVVDPVEVLKVKTGVYKGFSIGGSKVPGGYDKATKTISKMKLVEISLVDRPANPEAVITMYKADGIPEVTVAPEDAAAVDELAALLDSGEVSPQDLVAMVKAAKVADDAEDDDKAEGKDADAKKKKKGNPFAKIDADGAIQKGMYQVSRLADLLESIGYLVCSTENEAEWEKDDSKVPAQLRAWLVAGADVFSALAEEEVAEFVASFKPAPAAVVVQLSDAATTLRKSLGDAAQAGLIDFLAIGKAHMPENDIAKAVLDAGFDKAADLIVAKLDPAADLIAKLADADTQIAKLAAERDEALEKIAKHEAAPQPSKAVLRVIVKGGDSGAEPIAKAAVADEPILKRDGSVDTDAMALQEIKKVHQAGGRALLPIQ